MTLRWQIVSGASPAVRKWGSEYVVHHAMSNDTYRLSAIAGQILIELMVADTSPALATGSACSTEDADTVAALSALTDLGFITQC